MSIGILYVMTQRFIVAAEIYFKANKITFVYSGCCSKKETALTSQNIKKDLLVDGFIDFSRLRGSNSGGLGLFFHRPHQIRGFGVQSNTSVPVDTTDTAGNTRLRTRSRK